MQESSPQASPSEDGTVACSKSDQIFQFPSQWSGLCWSIPPQTRQPQETHCCQGLPGSVATKAIHLEVVSSLTTGAFNAALKRFVSRKGLPGHIYSDHGTNFVGARNELKELYNFLSLSTTDEAVSQCLLSKKVTWHHIPERAPHFGGIWESAVKFTKHHLKRTVGAIKLTFEELSTVACQVEACFNSRPYLAQDSHDPEGEMPLTSGHFLIGRPMQAYPEEPPEPDLTLQNRWELASHLCSSSVLHGQPTICRLFKGARSGTEHSLTSSQMTW